MQEERCDVFQGRIKELHHTVQKQNIKYDHIVYIFTTL